VNQPATDIQAVLRQHEGWTRVGVCFDKHHDLLMEHLLERAERMRLRLVDLKIYGGFAMPTEQIRGVLIDLVSTHERIEQFHDRGIPIVRILGGTPPDEDPRFTTVHYHWNASGGLAAEHFAERDFKHVAFVGRDPWGPQRTLYERFAARARALGMTPHLRQFNHEEYGLEHLPEAERWEIRQRLFQEWVGRLPKPIGLLARHDFEASRYVQWVTSAGARVPQDVAILGIGNNRMACESAPVALSSVAFNLEDLAVEALRCLTRHIEGQPETKPHADVPLLPTGVVTRQSTDVLAATDPRVVKALRFIWDHITQDLSVNQIADHVGVSRRTLERAFQRELKRGINEEFHRRRMKKTRELLEQTNLTVAQIADHMHFSSSGRLCRVFRAAFGTSPAAFRHDQRQMSQRQA